MPRSSKLEKEITRLKKDAQNLGFVLSATKTVDEDSYVLINKSAEKAVLIGMTTVNSQRRVTAYKINVNKWRWAEAEGFTRDQIIDDLGSEIFSSINISYIAEYLYK